MTAQVQYKLDDRLEDDFASEVLSGLASHPKSLPPRFLYDKRGSQLFEDITQTKEYYLTRTEIEILRTHAQDISRFIQSRSALVEFGSGASRKAGFLLDAMQDPVAYVPIDISLAFMAEATKEFSQKRPHIPIQPIAADFLELASLSCSLPPRQRCVGFFPGSTIGNLQPQQALNFLGQASRLLGKNAGFILGTDLKKDPKTLLAAYDDTDGITARFSLNLLDRINRELNADFNLSTFDHRVNYNQEQQRIEICIASLKPQQIHLLGETFEFAQNEPIYTEYAYKYDDESVHQLATQSGWQVQQQWCDPHNLFSVWFLHRNEEAVSA